MKIFTNLLFFSLFIFTTIAQSDTLKPGHSIKDGQTLVSAGNVFELGFFSPGTSTSRYVGIWYRNSNTTQIWVANRESPLTDTSGSINLTSDGNLAVLNSTNHLIWSTNSSTVSSNTTAQLTDSGNLIIIDGATGMTVTWRSFDHPADTFVPGMKISRPAPPPNSGENWILTSWRSPNDPSPGNFSIGLDTRGSAQFFIWENGDPRWRSGLWNGVTFIGTLIRPLYLYGFKLVTDSNGDIYFTFTPFNSSLVRFAMQWDGWEKTSVMVGNGWETVLQQPLIECDVYGKCGDHGVCVYDGGVSCHCLRGFEPKTRQDWKRGNWSGGCVRTTPLHCTSQSNDTTDVFFPVKGVKLPDLLFWASTVLSQDGCQSACANNCSCEAYAYPTGIGCLIWSRDLIDIYQFS